MEAIFITPYLFISITINLDTIDIKFLLIIMELKFD